MSDLSQELLVPGIARKRIISVIIVSGILLSVFAFSTFLFSMLMGSQRDAPSEQLEDAELEKLQLDLPPLPWDLEELQKYLEENQPELTQDQIQQLIDSIENMQDGDIQNMDLAMMGLAIAALLGSNIEVFRVYNYDSLGAMSDNLWRYECFDQFTGTGWESSAIKTSTPFFSYDDYYSDYSSQDLLKIQMSMNAPSIGASSFVVPSLFPTPFIMDGSVDCPTIDDGATILYKDTLNCTTLDVSFNSEESTALSYEMFGLDLPTNEEINNSAVDESYTPTAIKDQYLQLPTNIPAYISGNSFFQKHYSVLNSIIKPSDNAFMVANKIRNYLQANFSFDPMIYLDNGPEDGEDIVYWFSEHQKGVWSDFASAFCALGRAFGIAARFVDGFNSIDIVEEDDNGQNTFLIKYKNLYNWAEIFVPTDTSGSGMWVQMNVLYESFGEGGNPIPVEDFYLNLYSNFTGGSRNQVANITAHLSSPSASPANRLVSFTDLTMNNLPLGAVYTNDDGNASILIPIGPSQVVGPHIIQASYYSAVNYTSYVVYGPIQVDLSYVNPQNVNRSVQAINNQTNVQGIVWDPTNGQRVKNTTLDFVLLQKGTFTKVTSPFNPGSIDSNNNGEFDLILTVNPSVPLGQYQIRVDFNGSWYSIPIAVGIMSASSNRVDLNVSEYVVKKIYFYINNTPSSDAEHPVVTRWTNIALKAVVLDRDNVPLQNEVVEFRDITNNSLIGVNWTNANGITTLSYNVGYYSMSGPNLLVARVDNLKNYSYYILNEKPTINITSGPTPLEINRTGSGATQFRIIGNVNDTTNHKGVGFTEIILKLIKNGYDNSTYLIAIPPTINPFTTDKNGKFDITFRVRYDIPPGNYNLRIDFNGTYNLISNIYYPHTFYLSYINSSKYLTDQLKISAPDIFIFNFWINGTPTNSFTFELNRYQKLNFSASINCGGFPIADGEWVNFYDLTEGTSIGSDQTTSGKAEFIYQTTYLTIAGPHLVRASWSTKYNYSYYILDAPISVNLKLCPQPNIVNKSTTIDRTFTIRGFLNDSTNNNPIKFGEISVHMFDGSIDVTALNYLTLKAGWLQLNATGEIYAVYYVESSTPAKNYTLQVWFNGTFLWSLPNNADNPHNFFLPTTDNFSIAANGLYPLKVKDPSNVSIYLLINGSRTYASYSDINPPRIFQRGQWINFSVYITQAGSPVSINNASIYDVYINNKLKTFDMSFSAPVGYHEFILPTALWYAGLHQIKINWSIFETFNSTYVIINEPVDIFASSSEPVVRRDVDLFTVFGSVEESGVPLRGLRVRIVLLTEIGTDVSSYLDVYAGTIQTIDSDGEFTFYVDSISINCPQGHYHIRIDFNGSIEATGILLSNNMVNASSLTIDLNVTAGTLVIKDSYYTKYESLAPTKWINGDTLYVIGNLSYDNGLGLANMYLNVTVKKWDGTIIASNITVITDAFGGFNASLLIDENWPTYRSDTAIWVYFDPLDLGNNLQYVDGSYRNFML